MWDKECCHLFWGTESGFCSPLLISGNIAPCLMLQLLWLWL